MGMVHGLRGRWRGGHRVALAALWAAVMCGAGCAKSKEARRQAESNRVAEQAIAEYARGADRANAAHRSVLQAFAQANSASSLHDYRGALREQALPALDGYMVALQRVPTATQELKDIHGRLLAAYRTARSDLAAFEQGLQDPSGLSRFDEIRGRLQTAVRSYERDLAAYYARHGRRLQLPAAPAAAVAPAATSTPTAAPAALPTAQTMGAP